MEVRTINSSELEKLSLTLLEAVQKAHGNIDTLVGIASGGAYISRIMQKKLRSEGWHGSYFELSLPRSSTQTKRAFGLKRLLTKLPYSILDLLRKAESRFHEARKPAKCDLSSKQVPLLPEEKQIIGTAQSLLIVDDAVDTGTTLLAVKQTIQKINPDIKIITAVLTVTHKTPYIEPDHTLFRDVLLRCPWAEDYKGEDSIA